MPGHEWSMALSRFSIFGTQDPTRQVDSVASSRVEVTSTAAWVRDVRCKGAGKSHQGGEKGHIRLFILPADDIGVVARS